MGHPKLKSIFNKEYLLGSSLGNDANGEDDQVEDQENGYRIGILEGEEKVQRRRTDCLRTRLDVHHHSRENTAEFRSS